MSAEGRLELERLGIVNLNLMDGERLVSSLNLADGQPDSAGEGQDVVLLTDQRVIHIQGNGKGRRAVFASLKDVDVVEVSVEREGTSTFIWAGLAFLVALLLWLALDDSAWGKIGAVIVALMGVYLIVDHFITPGRPKVVFKTPSAELACELKTDEAANKVYDLVNCVFELKNGQNGAGNGRTFSPR